MLGSVSLSIGNGPFIGQIAQINGCSENANLLIFGEKNILVKTIGSVF